MQIDLTEFTQEFNRLVVARGRTLTRDQKAETLKVWYQEFRYWAPDVFQRVVKRLMYGLGEEKDAKWFPSLREVKEAKGAVLRSAGQNTSGPDWGCGVCKNGKIFYRNLNLKNNEVYDLVGCCLKCAPDMAGLGKVNHDWLHKDKLGVYRLPDALKADKKPTQAKWPAFLIETRENKHPGKKCAIPENPPNLAPEDDPDFELVIVEVRKPEVKMLVQEIGGALAASPGKDDPGQEVLRQKKLKEDKERDLAGVYN